MEKRLLKYILLGVVLVSCDNSKESIEVYQSKKRGWATMPSLKEVQNQKKEDYRWSAPKEWKKKKGNSIRLGSYVLLGKMEKDIGDLSIVKLSGTGGGVIANIVRWRGQLGLPSVSSKIIQEKIVKLRRKLGAFSFSFLKNDESGQGMLVAIYLGKGNTLFVKATGPIETLQKHKENFLNFLGTIYAP